MNRNLVAVAATIAIAFTTTAVVAQSDSIKERKTLFKEWGNDTKPVGEMLKGNEKFNLTAVQTALDAYVKHVKALPDLFPVGTETGGDTEALPAVWKDKAKFNDIFSKLGADAAAARTAITDEASFKKNFPGVLRNCKGCHDDFREKKT